VEILRTCGTGEGIPFVRHNWPIWERVIQMIATGQINLDLIISRVAGLPDWKNCFENMQSGEYVKAVLNPNL